MGESGRSLHKGCQGERLRIGGERGGPLGIGSSGGQSGFPGAGGCGEPSSVTRALSLSPDSHTDCAYVPTLHPGP